MQATGEAFAQRDFETLAVRTRVDIEAAGTRDSYRAEY